jgi:hypothetical protein
VIELLVELLRFTARLRAVGVDCDDDLLVEIAGDLDALVLRHAVTELERQDAA